MNNYYSLIMKNLGLNILLLARSFHGKYEKMHAMKHYEMCINQQNVHLNT